MLNGLHSRFATRTIEKIQGFHSLQGHLSFEQPAALHGILQGFIQNRRGNLLSNAQRFKESFILNKILAAKVMENAFHLLQAPKKIKRQFQLTQMVYLRQKFAKKQCRYGDGTRFSVVETIESVHCKRSYQ